MQFSIDRSDAITALAHAVRIIPAQAIRAILTGVRFATASGMLTLTASDSQHTFVTTVAAAIAQDGACVVPARYLYELIRRIPEGTIRCTSNDTTNELHLEWKQSTFIIPGYAAGEYPAISAFPDRSDICVPTAILQDAIAGTMYAAAVGDAVRPLLNGVHLQLSALNVQALATNGFQVAWYNIPVEATSQDQVEFVVPAVGLAHLQHLLENGGATCDIATKGSEIMFRVGNSYLSSRTLEGRFPKVLDIIPKEYPISAVLPRSMFAAALERVSLASDATASYAITISLRSDELILSSEGQLHGQARESLFAHVSGGEITLSYNSHQLLDGVRRFSCSELIIEFSSVEEITRFRAADGGPLIYMQMPLQTAEE